MTVYITECFSAAVSNAVVGLNLKKYIISNCKIWIQHCECSEVILCWNCWLIEVQLQCTGFLSLAYLIRPRRVAHKATPQSWAGFLFLQSHSQTNQEQFMCVQHLRCVAHLDSGFLKGILRLAFHFISAVRCARLQLLVFEYLKVSCTATNLCYEDCAETKAILLALGGSLI